MTLFIYNITTKHSTIRENLPCHEDVTKGYPWVYIDDKDIKYYPVYFNDKYQIAVVISKEKPS